MKNITITLDEKVARWARIRAAEQDTSVSRLVGKMLREKMLDEKDYSIAMQQYLSQPPRKLKKSGAKYPSHQRFGVRSILLASILISVCTGDVVSGVAKQLTPPRKDRKKG